MQAAAGAPSHISLLMILQLIVQPYNFLEILKHDKVAVIVYLNTASWEVNVYLILCS